MEYNPLQLRAKAIILGLKKGKTDRSAARSQFVNLVSDFFDEIGLMDEGRFDAASMILGTIHLRLFGHRNPDEITADDAEAVIEQFDTVNHGLF